MDQALPGVKSKEHQESGEPSLHLDDSESIEVEQVLLPILKPSSEPKVPIMKAQFNAGL